MSNGMEWDAFELMKVPSFEKRKSCTTELRPRSAARLCIFRYARNGPFLNRNPFFCGCRWHHYLLNSYRRGAMPKNMRGRQILLGAPGRPRVCLIDLFDEETGRSWIDWV